jgi:hypothetical protein
MDISAYRSLPPRKRALLDTIEVTRKITLDDGTETGWLRRPWADEVPDRGNRAKFLRFWFMPSNNRRTGKCSPRRGISL